MTGVAFTHELDLSAVQAAIGRLTDGQLHEVMMGVGALAEDQAKRRFDSAVGPDGAPWPAWSPVYAATRGSQHSLLVGEGHLRGSIASYVTGLEAQVGTNLVYGAVHQFGSSDGATPARPYLGVSDADAIEITDLLVTGIEGMLA